MTDPSIYGIGSGRIPRRAELENDQTQEVWAQCMHITDVLKIDSIPGLKRILKYSKRCVYE